jgi:hypothetical protein
MDIIQAETGKARNSAFEAPPTSLAFSKMMKSSYPASLSRMAMPSPAKPVPMIATDPGLLHSGDPAAHVFTDRGWQWGGYWRSPIDYMHFERP